jgi:hypothetical protein
MSSNPGKTDEMPDPISAVLARIYRRAAARGRELRQAAEHKQASDAAKTPAENHEPEPTP